MIGVARGVTVGSLRRFKAALIEPTQGLLERRRLRLWRSLGTPRVRCCYTLLVVSLNTSFCAVIHYWWYH